MATEGALGSAKAQYFTCPRCGGWAFGTNLDKDHNIVSYRCDSTVDGEPWCLVPGSETYRNRNKPKCGWVGQYDPKNPGRKHD